MGKGCVVAGITTPVTATSHMQNLNGPGHAVRSQRPGRRGSHTGRGQRGPSSGAKSWPRGFPAL